VLIPGGGPGAQLLVPVETPGSALHGDLGDKPNPTTHETSTVELVYHGGNYLPGGLIPRWNVPHILDRAETRTLSIRGEKRSMTLCVSMFIKRKWPAPAITRQG
jgi:hypothetical protein